MKSKKCNQFGVIMNKKTNFWTEPVKAGYIELLFTSLPSLIIISIFITFNTKKFYFLLTPLILITLMILSKPVAKCEMCGKSLNHKVKGLFDFHIQCDCVKGRWRPVWYLWCENIHNRVFKKSVS